MTYTQSLLVSRASPSQEEEGLVGLCYSSCANAKTLVGPIGFVDCYATSFTVDMLQDLLH